MTFLAAAPKSVANCIARATMAAKRKLNENDVPEEQEITEVSSGAAADFANLGLDPRLLQAISHEKYATPTPVQAAAIPLALKGLDVLGR